MSLLAASLMWFEADVWKDFSPYFAVWFLVPSKVNRTQIGAFSLVSILRSDRLDTVRLFHSAPWMYETGSCTAIWNVQEASAGGSKLALPVPFCESMSPDVQHSSALAVDVLSGRGTNTKSIIKQVTIIIDALQVTISTASVSGRCIRCLLESQGTVLKPLSWHNVIKRLKTFLVTVSVIRLTAFPILCNG